MAVPYTFGNATTSIPLSQLDTNFATAITIGNTAVYLGNTTTTFGNVTLNNVTINSGNSTVSSESISGNLTFTSTGNRILGDFSNATVANRVSFQDSTTNNGTYIQTLPNGTSQGSGVIVFNNSTPTNAAFMALTADATTAQVNSSITGTGTYLPMTFRTGGSERMRIDTSGNVGIGGVPSVKLDVQQTISGGAGLAARVYNPDTGATSAAYITAYQGTVQTSIYSYGNSGSYIGAVTNNFAAFITNNTERMRIDTSGNVGIGTTSPNLFGKLAVNSTAFSNFTGSSTSSIGITGYSNLGDWNGITFNANGGIPFAKIAAQYTASGTILSFGTSNNFASGVTNQAISIDQNGNVGIGTSSPGRRLDVEQSGTDYQLRIGDAGGSYYYDIGRSTTNGFLTFYGSQSGANGYVFTGVNGERMRIDSSGNLLVGTTSAGGKLSVSGNLSLQGSDSSIYRVGGNNWLVVSSNTGYGSSGAHLKLDGSGFAAFYNTSTATVTIPAAGIYATTTASAANMFVDSSNNLARSTSSLKYKTDVKDATHGLAEVMQLRPVTYKGKNDGNKVFGGLIAEEVDAVGLTEFVQYAEDGSPDALAYGNMVSLLVKAIQQLKAEIDALKGTK